jgi:hypothetical protein
MAPSTNMTRSTLSSPLSFCAQRSEVAESLTTIQICPMTPTHWTDLLAQPKALLAPYHGNPPRLESFAPHGLREELGSLSLAGRFLDLPDPAPQNWRRDDKVFAYCVFDFDFVRLFSREGVFEPGEGSDPNHGFPLGVAGTCTLTRLDEELCQDTGSPWKRFEFDNGTACLVIEAAYVTVHTGTRAYTSFAATTMTR